MRTLRPVDVWEPQQHNRFAAERRQPFNELLAMCNPVDGGLVYDLGCGTGALTEELHREVRAGKTIGIDASDAMLSEARARQNPQVSFQRGDLGEFASDFPPALILSNASLQWVDDHARILECWRSQLAPSGQLAIHLPTGSDHPAFSTAATVAQRHMSAFGNGVPQLATSRVERPETYATLLCDMDATDLWVSVRAFTHELPSSSEVVEWMKGTALNAYKAALDQDAYGVFLEDYTEAFFERVGQQEPYRFTFERMLVWAQFN